MPSIYSHFGRLAIDFQLAHEGRRIRCREFLGVADTKEGRQAARKKKRVIEAALVTGELTLATYPKFFPGSKLIRKMGLSPAAELPTLEGALDKFLERKTLDKARPGTVDYYRQMFEPIVLRRPKGGAATEPLARRRVDTIRRIDIDDLLDAIAARGVPIARVNRVRSALTGVFKYLATRYPITENPVSITARRKVERADVDADGEIEDQEDGVDPFTADEARAIIAAAKAGRERVICETAIGTGARPGEVFGLKWNAIDFKENRIAIRIGVTRFGPGEPKTKKSRRLVDMNARVRAALLEHRRAFQFKSNWVFANARKGPMSAHNWNNREWHAILSRAGVRFRSFGQCRHTWATLMLGDPNVSLRYIADQMGHATLEMLFKHYLRWMPGRTPRPARDVVAEALNASAKGAAK